MRKLLALILPSASQRRREGAARREHGGQGGSGNENEQGEELEAEARHKQNATRLSVKK